MQIRLLLNLLKKWVKLALTEDCKGKLGGGAQMFTFADFNDNIRIGLRNIEASREVLAQLDIPIVSEDVGGSHGRTIELYSDDGKLLIKTVGFGINYI